jgi:hypothetical protein
VLALGDEACQDQRPQGDPCDNACTFQSLLIYGSAEFTVAQQPAVPTPVRETDEAAPSDSSWWVAVLAALIVLSVPAVVVGSSALARRHH